MAISLNLPSKVHGCQVTERWSSSTICEKNGGIDHIGMDNFQSLEISIKAMSNQDGLLVQIRKDSLSGSDPIVAELLNVLEGQSRIFCDWIVDFVSWSNHAIHQNISQMIHHSYSCESLSTGSVDHFYIQSI